MGRGVGLEGFRGVQGGGLKGYNPSDCPPAPFTLIMMMFMTTMMILHWKLLVYNCSDFYINSHFPILIHLFTTSTDSSPLCSL